MRQLFQALHPRDEFRRRQHGRSLQTRRQDSPKLPIGLLESRQRRQQRFQLRRKIRFLDFDSGRLGGFTFRQQLRTLFFFVSGNNELGFDCSRLLGEVRQ